MAIDDPKTRMRPRETDDEKPAESLSIADLVAALKAFRGDDDDAMKKRAQYDAEAQKRVLRPENERAPGISVYSHPEGDRDHPKDPLKCQMFWVGIPLEIETLRPDEIALLNQAEPGTYHFTRTDGTREKLTIDGEHDAYGKLHKLVFRFPVTGEYRHNLPSLVSMLREAFGVATNEEDLRRQIAELKSQLVAVAR